jgi:hypothetical protein
MATKAINTGTNINKIPSLFKEEPSKATQISDIWRIFKIEMRGAPTKKGLDHF